ncbi:hypothetical protein [Mycolicibacterium vaccae]|uniref:hypothetical protein n=1 Tax=Mycolicibacterium vaccae TaxID=1810 RepID=UPI0007679208|nr:hypothetical protein [Mycolicibacterium vaccae]
MNLEERLAHHVRMAETHRDDYLRQGVQDGEAFADAGKFAEDGVYVSPYFTGDQVFPFSEFPTDTAKASTMEAKAYSLKFPDRKPAGFDYWPASNGLTMKTRWEGHTADGVKMGFYSYSFVLTNDEGELTRWETHVNDEHSAFLDVAVGVRGPFHALERTLAAAGVTV